MEYHVGHHDLVSSMTRTIKRRRRRIGISKSLLFLISFWIQYSCQYISNTAAWRIPWGVQGIPAVILFAGMWLFPFSPRWLADKGRMEEAKKVLADVHGGGDVNHPRVQMVQRSRAMLKGYAAYQLEESSHIYIDFIGNPRDRSNYSL